MSEPEDHNRIYAKTLLDDARARLQFQHEYALGGFKTLILINGGAIIGLLTYAGNVLQSGGARRLGAAFLWYVVGLASTTLSYLFAYFSQGKFMDFSTLHAQAHLGLVSDAAKAEADADRLGKTGTVCVNLAIVLVLAGLGFFIAGSVSAMKALIS